RFTATTDDGRSDRAGRLYARQFHERVVAAPVATFGADSSDGVGSRFRALLAASCLPPVHSALAASRSASFARCALRAKCSPLPPLREGSAFHIRHRALPAPGRGSRSARRLLSPVFGERSVSAQ